MKVLVGLGNPGSSHSNARHNVGFQVMDAVAKTRAVAFRPGPGPFYEAEDPDDAYLLVKPSTFVNASGVAVRWLAENRALQLDDLLVVYDDMDLPLGAIRLRPRGGAGGHKGMESVIYHLRSDAFPRLRLGIDSPARGDDDVAFVLSSFTRDESLQADEMISRAAEAAFSFVAEGLSATMERFNAVPQDA